MRGRPGPACAPRSSSTISSTRARRAGLAPWVRAGGTLVVADPASQLQPGVPTVVGNGFTTGDLSPTGPCPALGLDDVNQLSVGQSLLLRPPTGRQAITCYGGTLTGGETASFLVAVPLGSGSVIGLGGAGVWTNARLSDADNAALALGLLAPAAGARVDVLIASPGGSGTQSALSLLNPRWKTAVLQLLVAFVLLAWWRGRRLGRPVTEDLLVQLPGNELVLAVSGLLARTHSRDAAAAQLRSGSRGALGARLGLGPRASVDQIADAAASRSPVPRDRVVALLTDAPLTDDPALVRLAQALVQLRQEVTHG